MNNEIIIVVDISYKPQFYSSILNAIDECANDSIIENGCERYDVYPNINNSQKITLVEMWRDLDSLGQHKTQPHYLKLQTSLENRVLSIDIQTA